VLLFKNSLQKL